MDPTMVQQLHAGWGLQLQGMHVRAEQDHRVLGSVLTRMLVQAGDPSTDADLNAAIRTPSTIEHPTYSSANNPGVQK
jgi:hypothetical protein